MKRLFVEEYFRQQSKAAKGDRVCYPNVQVCML